MKILLLSDIPPCENLTAGLVLSAMVRFLPRDTVCCFAVVNAHINIKISTEFANIPIVFHRKPNENWSWLPQRRFLKKISSAVSFVGESFTERTSVRTLINEAVSFGREQKVDRVWAVLQGQTTIRMAKEVADRLGVPLHTHVWDPFSWWANANKLDGISTRRTQALFDDAIRHSAAVATASEAMAEHYRDRFAVRALPVISSHHRSVARTPIITSGVGSRLVIGMAGQFYAADEWLKLIKALTRANWHVEGRPVKIVVLGPQKPPEAPEAYVSFLGWKSQSDAAEILSQCDILYCPYPFAHAMKEVSQFSFPSKLVLYLAAGRPIVFHGPEYSSPAHYIIARDCGLIADRISPTAVFNEIERLVSDPGLYATKGLNAQAAFRNDFTLESMASAFNAFIGADVAAPRVGQTYDHSRAARNSIYETGLSERAKRYSFSWQALRGARLLAKSSSLFKRLLKRTLRLTTLRFPIPTGREEMGVPLAENKLLTHAPPSPRAENSKLDNVIVSAADLSEAGNDFPSASFTELASQLSDRFDGETTYQRSLIFTQSAEAWNELTGNVAGEAAAAIPDVGASRLADPGHRFFKPAHISFLFGGPAKPLPFGTITRWADAKAAREGQAFKKLLRAVLEENCQRLIAFSEDFAGAATAIAVAELLSLPVYLLVNGENDGDKFAWAAEHVRLEVVEVRMASPLRSKVSAEAPNTELARKNI